MVAIVWFLIGTVFGITLLAVICCIAIDKINEEK